MDQTIKDQWVAALRSGIYRQGRIELRAIDTNTYCVNGVLCDLHSHAHGAKGWEQLGSVRLAWFYLGNHSFPDTAVRRWAEIDTDTLEMLEGFNDAHHAAARLSFEELALYIENNL